jgi:hypothetical protein
MRALSLVLVCVLLAAPVGAQQARVSAEQENFRAEPAGRIVASLERNAPLRLGARRGNWRAATVEAWIWAASVRPEKRDGHDLVVSAEGGENLRAEPRGAIIGRAAQGMLLNEIERQGGWVKVRRAAWIWQASVSEPATPRAATPRAAAAPQPTPPAANPRPQQAASTPAASPSAPRPRAAAEWTNAGESGAALLSAPGGDTVGRLQPFASVEVVSREGNWARVRTEAWIWSPALRAAGDTTGVLRNVTTESLTTNPSGFRGRVIELEVHFIALEKADKIRTDFYEGEPYILARAGGDGFVYIAVSEDQAEGLRHTQSLSRLRVIARVRTGRSALMAAPVLELLESVPLRASE